MRQRRKTPLLSLLFMMLDACMFLSKAFAKDLPRECPGQVMKLDTQTYTAADDIEFSGPCTLIGTHGTDIKIKGSLTFLQGVSFNGSLQVHGRIQACASIAISGNISLDGAIKVWPSQEDTSYTPCVDYVYASVSLSSLSTNSRTGDAGHGAITWQHLWLHAFHATVGGRHVNFGPGQWYWGAEDNGIVIDVSGHNLTFMAADFGCSGHGASCWGPCDFQIHASDVTFEGGSMQPWWQSRSFEGGWTLNSTGNAKFIGFTIISDDWYQSSFPGGVLSLAGNLTFVNSSIGGDLSMQGVSMVGNMTFVNTSIAAWAAGIEISGTASFRNCRNRTSHTSCLRTSFPVHIRGNVSFIDCKSPDEGGAIWIGPYPIDRQGKRDTEFWLGPRALTIEGNVSFRNCSCAGEGGAIFVDNSSVGGFDDMDHGVINITGSASFTDCSAGFAGGAMWSSVPVALNGHFVFEECTALLGGAICGFQHPITINGSTQFHAIKAGSDGGAIFAYNGASVAVYGKAFFSECSAKERGGVIFASATVKMAGDTSFLNCCASHGAILNVIAGDIILSGTTSVGHSQDCSQSTGTPMMLLASASPNGSVRASNFNASSWTLNTTSMLNEEIHVSDDPVLSTSNVAQITFSDVVSHGHAQMLNARGVTHGVVLKDLSLKQCGSQCVSFSQIPHGGDMTNISISCRPGEFPFATEVNVTEEHVESLDVSDCTYKYDCCKISKTYGNSPSLWSHGKDTGIYCNVSSARCLCQSEACDSCLLRNTLDTYSAGCQRCKDGTVSLRPSDAWCRSWQEDWVLYESSRSFCVDCEAVLANSIGNTVVACSGNSLHAPRGAMVFVTDEVGTGTHLEDAAKTLQAYHCPNARACPGGNLSVNRHGVIEGIGSMCQGEYAYSPGCTSCRYPEAGRQMRNGLKCGMCGSPFVGWASFVLQPTLVFLLGCYSAAKMRRSRLSELFNIMLGFGTFTGVVYSLMASTEAYHDLSSWLRTLAGLPAEVVATGTASIYSSSLDCLYNTVSNDGAPSSLFLLMMQVFMPALICIGLLITAALKAESCKAFLTRNLLVLSNIALPNLAASLLLWTPCMKMSGADGATMLMVYSPSNDCNPITSVLLGFFSLGFFVAVGPLAWWRLIKRYRKTEESERQWNVGYLVYRYKAGTDWWSIVVLCRKTFLTCLAVLCPASYASGSQLACLLAAFFASCVLQFRVQPYEEEDRCVEGIRGLSLNQVELGTLVASTVILIFSASFIFPSWGRPYEIGAIIAVVISLIVACTASALIFLFVLEFRDSGMLEQGLNTVRRRAGRCWHCVCCCCRKSPRSETQAWPAASQSLVEEDQQPRSLDVDS